MDPNAALKIIRELVTLVADEDEAWVIELCETVQGLDNWLSSGGFPPEAWHYDPRADA